MIRAAVPADIPALIEMGRRMVAESPRYRDERLSDERLKDTLSLLIESAFGFVHVIEVDGRLVGTALAAADQHWCLDGLFAQELVLFVDREHRGGLAATRLVTHMVAWAKTMGCRKLIAGASTGIADQKVVDLYQTLGFDVYGTVVAMVFEGA